MEWTNKQTLET